MWVVAIYRRAHPGLARPTLEHGQTVTTAPLPTTKVRTRRKRIGVAIGVWDDYVSNGERLEWFELTGICVCGGWYYELFMSWLVVFEFPCSEKMLN